MAHYAKVSHGIVTNVIVAEPEFFETFIDTTPGEWVQTSYNTRGGVLYLPDSDTPSGKPALRGNYAAIGHIYDRVNDVFYLRQPYPSWTLNNTTWTWEAPIPRPNDGKDYIWDESTTSWIIKNNDV